MNLKSILIDTNFCNDTNGEPAISPVVVEIFDLTVGENVIVYQDEDEWRGIVRFDPLQRIDKQWFIEIVNDSHQEISPERQKGQNEGYYNGRWSGKLSARIEIAEEMIRDGLDLSFVQKYTKLSKERLLQLI
ncbi:hypothetical protein [Brevibacillus borstelensis]|uniref:hypothetical protein n=1 Tax=Brevibacillus borstelensis TaxID=45462 RepID=UPI0030BE5063